MSLRVTTNMMSSRYMRNINTNLSRLQKYEYQLISQNRLTALSDDPVGVIKSMEARVRLGDIGRFKENVADAKTWIKQSETSINELNEILKSVYEDVVGSANSYLTPEDKASVAEKVREMRDHVLTLGNSKLGDKYIFGGFNTAAPPFTLDAGGNVLYNSVSMSGASHPDEGKVIQYEIGYNLHTDVSMSGTQLLGMGDENVYAILDKLYNALKSDASAEEISGYSKTLMDAQSRTLANLAEIGGKSNRLDLMSNRYEVDELNFTEIKSKVEDVDVAEVTVQWKTAISVYNYALKVGATILQNSLLDYIN